MPEVACIFLLVESCYLSGYSQAMKLVLALLLFATSAHAGCHDSPGPNVDWSFCHMPGYMNLAGKNLSSANLTGVWLQSANLTGALLVNAQMAQANLPFTKLINADLTGAHMADANFYLSDLSGSRFKGANFSAARNLAGAKKDGADFSGALWVDGRRACLPGSIGTCNLLGDNKK